MVLESGYSSFGVIGFIPLWFDLILLISFAWNGLLLGFVSLIEIHQVLLKIFSVKTCWISISLILLLSGYGISLGRFERWNSWDILMHPLLLLSQFFGNLQKPETLTRILGVTFSFGIFLMISYSTIYFLSNKHETTK